MPKGYDAPAPDGDFTARWEDTDTILRLYARLKREEREFLNLRYVMELSDAEIAALYGMEVKAVSKRYQRRRGAADAGGLGALAPAASRVKRRRSRDEYNR
ncbi:MAG: sigma-70 family RNA polymerase sigma factor [Oscillospiraceae bacterium]|nr:sigma-70 family RNA polymerase sigma factor [Oscillospiraceae bacterium]